MTRYLRKSAGYRRRRKTVTEWRGLAIAGVMA